MKLADATPLSPEEEVWYRQHVAYHSPYSWQAKLFATLDAEKAKLKELLTWEDVKDEWTEAIDAAFPTRSGSHDEWGVAMKMVGHRHSKGELVSLVNWLLVRLRDAGLEKR